MAKGLRLVSKAIKLGYKQVDLFLNSSQPVGVLILDFLQVVNPIWNAFGGTADDEALLLLPRLREVNGCPSALVSVSIGNPYSGSPSSSSLGKWTLILVIVRALIAEGVGIRLISWGISTSFAWKSLMSRLGRISFAYEVVLVSSAMMENAWILMSM